MFYVLFLIYIFMQRFLKGTLQLFRIQVIASLAEFSLSLWKYYKPKYQAATYLNFFVAP